MLQLLKAEWYRLWRSSHLYIWYILFLVLTMIFSVMEFNDDTEYVTFVEKIAHLTDLSTSSICIILPVITAVSVSMLYHNKTGYYQIMCGHKISHILFSKILIDGVFLSMIWGICHIGYYVYYGFVNGTDGLDQIPLRIFLVFLAVLRSGITGVLLAEIIEHPAAGVLSFVRFVFVDGLYAMLVNIFVTNQMWNNLLLDLSELRYVVVPVTSPDELSDAGFVLSSLIVPGIVSLILETGVWYIAAYTKMKRKKYNINR